MHPRPISTALGLTLLAATLTTAIPADAAEQPGSAPISAYTLVAPRSTAASGLVVRAVMPAGADCPEVEVVRQRNGNVHFGRLDMRERSAPATTYPAFASILVCSAHLPLDVIGASVAGRPVPAALPAVVDEVAMVSDTGCRIASFEVQDCSSAVEWPLAAISQSIADEEPDVVLVVGDFYYREAACPPTAQALCGSSPPPVTGLPFTDSAYGWIADVLLPMAPLLSSVPLVMVRGNHEACNRGGNGYFLLLDPRDGTEDACAPVPGDTGLVAAATVPTGTYAIDMAVAPGRTLRLAVVDSAGGSDTRVTAFASLQRPAYQRAAGLTRSRPGRESWLLTHRPVYGYVTTQFAVPGAPFNPWTSADQTASSEGLLGSYEMVLSSHIHIAQAVRLPGLPSQLVLGNGGTQLDPAIGYPLPSTPPTAGYPLPDWAWVAPRFGYAIATPLADAGAWRISMRDPAGEQFARCGLRDASLYCVDGS
ncbi:MAG: metallophosphoesterase [Actinomycetota bacterium]|nr:metallophosphoesterase [Actinomycetota bacterium]